MGIYSHGMKLPKDGCKSCVFDILGICLIRANMDKPYEVTHSCPLIELPPHGRLGDLDAMMAKDTADFAEAMNVTASVSTRSLMHQIHAAIQKAIGGTEVIIPAERGANDG